MFYRMRISILKFIISILLITSAGIAYGQNKKSNQADTLKADFIPTGVRLGYDVLGLGLSIANDNLNSKLFVADIDFHRYFLVLEYGQYERTRGSENSLYNTDGSFWRVGTDVNFFHRDPDKSVFSIGLRYGNSTFDDQLTTTISSDIFGDRLVTFQNDNVNADWFELVLGLKVPVWKLWLGYNMRMKIGIDDFKHMDFSPYEVPGYGLAAENDYWEVNYYVMYRIGWRK